ncbi:MAG: hypothetical protein JJLCMIEE_00236 [Acidimicrobiales bacterium]|nr:MAG: ester cyclase [Actinomycetota bacterium]MBV6507195.1 hypothetical protein [Acidimicrobiales bacterium]RIK05517.1 MAG: ester cyclase [Acidobacteriota bacterium]
MNAAAGPEATHPDLRARREELVRRHFEAQNQLDLEAALDTLDEPRLELIGTNRVFVGRDEVAQYFRESRHVFPDQQRELIALHHGDDAIVVEFWFSGTMLGELPGIHPTGRRFRARLCAICEFEQVRLTCVRIYFDAGTIARQLA